MLTRKPVRDRLGFTLIEMVVVVLIVSVLGAIAAASWTAFLNLQQLNTSQDQVLRAMREAQSNAKRDKLTWQVSFQQVKGVAQWAVNRSESNEFIPAGISWNQLGQNIQVNKDATTLYRETQAGRWRIQFNYKGHPQDELAGTKLGKITLSIQNGGQRKRCVIASTLIGTLRTDKDKDCSK